MREASRKQRDRDVGTERTHSRGREGEEERSMVSW